MLHNSSRVQAINSKNCDLTQYFCLNVRRPRSERRSVHQYVTERATKANEAVGQKNKSGFLGLYDQAIKRTWWMPWRQEAMKDVVVCDKPWIADKLALTQGFPNGETHPLAGILH